MIVAKEIAFLKTAIEELEEKYCQNCQDWDCDYCWADVDCGIGIIREEMKKNYG